MTTVPLDKLKFGDDFPGGSINARKTKSDEGLLELGATILDKGLISPLIVKTHEGKIYVSEGNRRLRAMRLLVKDGKIPKSWPVKVDELDAGVDPLEASLTANIMQLPMHEVDQYEAFAKLASDGKSVADIASSFGTSELMVNRRMALGGLAPVLREAWRDGKITSEAAQAFTVSRDHDLQHKVYTALARAQNLYRHAIIRALTSSDRVHEHELRFVGRSTYLAAGGRLVDDLFADEAHVLDVDTLKRLAREKVDAECRRLLEEGWGWAALDDDLPMERWRWPRAEVEAVLTDEELTRVAELDALVGVIERKAADRTREDFRAAEQARADAKAIRGQALLRSFSVDDKARSGCILEIDGQGKLKIDSGRVRPDGSGAPVERSVGQGRVEEDPVAEDEAGLSRALAQSLSEQLTTAAATALVDQPDLALRILVAALQAHYGAPARLHLDGMSGLLAVVRPSEHSGRGPSFAEALDLALKASLPLLRAELATFVAASLDLTDASREHPAKAVKGQQALIEALDPAGYLAAARTAFDADGFFDRAPVSVALDAIAEMGAPKPSGKKGVIALAAATLARELGWLPAKLRSCRYVPPRVEDRGRSEPTASPRQRGRKKAAPGGAAAAP